jgi:hypothetical protein
VASPFAPLVDEGSQPDYATPVRQRRVTGLAFPGARPFALLEVSGRRCSLRSMSKGPIRNYGRDHVYLAPHIIQHTEETITKREEGLTCGESVVSRAGLEPATR